MGLKQIAVQFIQLVLFDGQTDRPSLGIKTTTRASNDVYASITTPRSTRVKSGLTRLATPAGPTSGSAPAPRQGLLSGVRSRPLHPYCNAAVLGCQHCWF